MIPSPKTFEMTLDRGVCSIVLNRPDRLNSLTFAVYRELAETFETLSHITTVRVITLSGKGRGFCSGGDQDDIIAELFSYDSPQLLEFTRMTGRLIHSIRTVRRPVIAGIQGACVGAGAVIAAACDLRIADKSAKFGFIFPRVGLSGADMGASYLLPRIIGHGRASEILFFGEIFDAEEAMRLGFLNRLTEPGEHLSLMQQWAEKLARGPAFAHSITKVMLEKEHSMSLAEAIEAEAQAQALCMTHPDFREAHEAWKEKRVARFK